MRHIAHMSIGQLGKIERGETRHSTLSTLERLAWFYRVTVESLASVPVPRPIEIDGPCPECISGVMAHSPDEGGCTCFKSAPCGSCTNGILECTVCGFEHEDKP